MLDKINEVAAKQRRVDAERDALLGKALAFQAVLNKVFGDARVVGQSSTEILERYGPDDGAYGHLYYEGTELWVAFRTNEDDLEDAHHKDDNPSYRMRSPGEVPRTWLEPLLTKESLESLIADIGGRVDAQAARVARATTGVDSIVAAESAKIDVQLAHSLQAFGSTTLQDNWNATIDALHLNPADGLTRSSSFVEAVCAEILRARGIEPPDTMRPLIETVLANLAWPEDSQVLVDVKRVTSGVSTLCQGVGALRTHYGSAHGNSSHLPPLDQAYATLAKNAGAAVAIFLIDRHKHDGNNPPADGDA